MKETIDACPSDERKLYDLAKAAREKAYAPYSGCKVGAAIRVTGGLLFTGANVENSSFGGTICAERSAIARAVGELGPIEVLEVMVVTDAVSPWPPCGLCRQFIAEFGPHCTVHAANLQGTVVHFRFQDLYPHPFGPEQMHR